MKKTFLTFQLLLVYFLVSAQFASLGDIRPGSSSNPNNLFYFNNIILFNANTDTYGVELWKTDGSVSGTKIVKDLLDGPDGSLPSNFIKFNNAVYFTAYSMLFQCALWKTDGTPEGTVMIKTFPGTSNGIYNLAIVNNNLLFIVDRLSDTGFKELWITDGSALGTTQIKSNFSLIKADYYGGTNMPVVFNNNLYFVGSDVSSGVGEELWRTDGTAQGTYVVKDINEGSKSSNVSWLTVLNDHIIFSAYVDSIGQELWKTDGTEIGTTFIKDINPGVRDSYASDLSAGNGKVIFSADNGINSNEPWITDGTPDGTKMLINLNTTFGEGEGGSNPSYFTFTGSQWFFEGNGTLYKTDGTALNTLLIKETNGPVYPNHFTWYNNLLYFAARDNSHGIELWRSDGTSNGTLVIADVDPGLGNSNPNSLTGMGSDVYFSAETPAEGNELFKTGALITYSKLIPAQSINMHINRIGNTIDISGLQPGDELIIHNMLGKQLYSDKIRSNQKLIRLNQYASGILILSVKHGNELIYSNKLIVE